MGEVTSARRGAAWLLIIEFGHDDAGSALWVSVHVSRHFDPEDR